MQRRNPTPTARVESDQPAACPNCGDAYAHRQTTRELSADPPRVVEYRFVHDNDGPDPGTVCVVRPDAIED